MRTEARAKRTFMEVSGFEDDRTVTEKTYEQIDINS
jgi:hypothetical protein